jgi:hypothetical protein
MKVAGDVPVFLVCKDDSSGKEINMKEKIDSVGYRYRSFWIANENYDDSIFTRIYRRDSSYVRWTNAFPNDPKTCLVKLNKDSLYAIGGKLTIEARGALAHVDNINNYFEVNSDSITSQNDTIRHNILIDHDPSNADFLTLLDSDLIRAIAWVEYAASNDRAAHCDNPTGVFNPQWNNYWDARIYAGDTCRDSLMPCENTISSAAGTMQLVRGTWEDPFSDTLYIHQGYNVCRWDSLEWNWQINIENGKFILFTDNRLFMKPEQAFWDSTCTQCDESDSFPKYPNQEDLWVYGYKNGATQMRQLTAKNWESRIEDNERGKYVRDVRGSKYAKLWQ